MIIIIDHGQGNIGSLKNSINQIGEEFKLCSTYEQFHWDNKINGFILPGVGSFDKCMVQMRQRKLDKLVELFIDKGVKGMGICLGMQILCNSSEEGNKEDGLGIIKGTVKKLNSLEDKVPNMGWNKTFVEEDAQIDGQIKDILNGEYYYVHSYAVEVVNAKNKVASFNHGKVSATAAIYSDRILGVQFHPEKSQAKGLELIKNYFI